VSEIPPTGFTAVCWRSFRALGLNCKSGAQTGGAPYFSFVHDLFSEEDVDLALTNASAPLATRMRPRSLDEFVGQEHILGPGKLLPLANRVSSRTTLSFS
jgi:hypothetical protein